MSQWQLEVLGSDPPLPIISECLAGTDWSLEQDDADSSWHLARAGDEAGGSTIADEAALIFDRISTVYSFRNPGSEPFSLAPPVLLKADGSRIYFIRVDHVVPLESAGAKKSPAATAEIVEAVWIPSSCVLGSSFDYKQAFEKLSKADPKTEALIRSFVTRPRDWRDIYNVVELIDKMVGGIPEDWIDGRTLKTLKHTACSWGEAGRTGRHANPRRQDPGSPMSIEEGERTARRVLEVWLQSP